MRTTRKGVYCNEGLVPGVRRDTRNRRVIHDRALARVRDLACLKRCGFGIAELGESIGNFDERRAREVLDAARIRPAVNQVECHPYYQRDDLRAFLADNGIAMEVWYPLGHGDEKLLAEPALGQIAQARGAGRSALARAEGKHRLPQVDESRPHSR